ncbi:UDP-2,3-diacylglucosamine diphosphatase [Noviherbaspirillum sedimenti]|uniref:UDP-2,3-diacylglucosamine hydrolase n=1 Tax=Noviherbaspirillum sedimenti TaxID=2320865 RepID=A0A3A3FWF4_9BURK|nr:UDP-2,3-diacylglucosamine diphosphatase [Noviherbaspirillum sedimenti]RJG00497.1 UDP-2,3-diacylglucosamine diphosphatase [Noviherbaspirillum sedimenti]
MTASHQASKAQPETVALFVSDVHLHESLPKTTQAFLDFLQHHARHAGQLYLLGDLFEYWAGDDDLDSPYIGAIIAALRALSAAGVQVFWIAGNRDFLVSEAFAAATGITLLPDPYVTSIAGRQLALAHGDALCTDDTGYMAFRAQVRQPQWQREFLAMPLEKRKAIIAGMRDQSRAAQREKSYEIMDVNPAAVSALFDATGAELLIHGHTHRPARHSHPAQGGERLRYVLPDWDCDTDTPRGGWIALNADGAVRRLGLDGQELA